MASWVVTNLSDRRLRIARQDGGELWLPGLGSLQLEQEDVSKLQTEEWEREHLITLLHRDNENAYAAIGFAMFGLVAVLIGLLIPWIASQLNHPLHYADQLKVGLSIVAALLTALILVVVVSAFGPLRAWFDRTVDFVGRLGTFLVILGVSFGLPGLAYLWWDPTDGRTLTDLLYLLGAAFSVLAVLLPPSLYFLFARLRLPLVRRAFVRDVLALDASLRTSDEVAAKYSELIDDVFGVGSAGALITAGVPVVLCTMLVAIGWTVVLDTYGFGFPGPRGATAAQVQLEALIFAFLGSYFFGLQMLFRRYLRSDLAPKAYVHFAVRILVTSVMVWALSSVPVLTTGPQKGLLYLLAFTIGVVPETGYLLINRLLRNVVGKASPTLSERHSLNALEGVTLYDSARLMEEGIENVESLAHHNLPELMLRTRLPTPRLIDLVDQAALYLHLTDSIESPTTALYTLRGVGIRTATDLLCAMDAAGDDTGPGKLAGLLSHGANDVPRLPSIARVLKDDEWVADLQTWRRTRMRPEEVATSPADVWRVAGAHAKPAPINGKGRAAPVKEAAPASRRPDRASSGRLGRALVGGDGIEPPTSSMSS